MHMTALFSARLSVLGDSALSFALLQLLQGVLAGKS